MWDNKLKAVTFSFDDGVTQDIKAIEILNKYGIKATFNLNSGNLGKSIICSDGTTRKFISKDDVKKIYFGHEIAVHTINHPNLTELSKEEIIYQVEEDRKVLSELCGYNVIGMAYPCGGVNNDDRVAQIIKENTGVKYSRTITSTNNFDLQNNLYRFNPSVYHVNKKDLFSLGKEFVNLKTETPKLFYVWGHAYEFDEGEINFNDFEEFCRLISNHSDIFYGVNKDCLFW